MDNRNFAHGTFTVDSSGDQMNYLIPPFYNFPWWSILWYMNFGEYNYFRNFVNWSRVKSTGFQVSINGSRLPFSTGDNQATIANSSVDQQLDVFHSIEKCYPFDMVVRELGASNEGRLITTDETVSNDLRAGWGFSWLAKRLYGYRNINDAVGQSEISAEQGHRRYDILPRFYTLKSGNTGTSLDPNGDKYHTQAFKTWPAFATLKDASYD